MIDKLIKKILKANKTNEDLENQLREVENYYLLKDFEAEKYDILFQDGGKKLLNFNNDDKTRINVDDFWKSEIGKIKTSILFKNHKHWFVREFNNFSTMTLKDKKFLGNDFRDLKIILKNCRFENCEFSDISLMPLKYSENKTSYYTNICYLELTESVFLGCKFTKTNFLAESANKCSFYGCYDFKECGFGDNGICSTIEKINISNCKFNDTKFNLDIVSLEKSDASNISNSSFVNSSLKNCRFKNCRIEECIFTNCNFMYAQFWERNYFGKNLFEESNFSGTNLTNIAFDRNNSFKNNYYDITTQIENNYLNKCKSEGRSGILTYQYIADIHYNFYNEYKNTSMKDKAYEQYYAYKKVTMLKNFPVPMLQDLMDQAVFINWSSKRLIMIFLVMVFTFVSFQAILTIGMFVLILIGVLILLAVLGGKFSREFLSYIICGFGERPKRALIWMMSMILGCAYFFMYTGVMINVPGGESYSIMYESIFTKSYLKNSLLIDVNIITFVKDYFKCLYFSVVTFTTIGFGDVVPITKWGKLLVMIEAVSSIFLINIFTATFIRKIIRD